MRSNSKQWALSVKAQSGRLRSMIMWSDDLVERAVPPWWSHHRPTHSWREWILFGLALISHQTIWGRQYMQMFSILPQESCVRFRKCTSTDMSGWHVDTQLVWIKNWQSSEASSSTVGKSIYRNTCTWQQKAVPKRFSAGSQKRVIRGAEMIYFQLLKRAIHTFSTPKLITNGYRGV